MTQQAIIYAGESNAHPREIKLILTRKERHFCKCAACKQSTTVDFLVVVYEFSFKNGDRVIWEPRAGHYTLEIDEQGNEVAGEEVRNTYIANCPRCGAAKPKRTQFKSSTHNPRHVCSDKCQKATSDTCDCSCGGKGHGIKNKMSNSLF